MHTHGFMSNSIKKSLTVSIMNMTISYKFYKHRNMKHIVHFDKMINVYIVISIPF